MESETSIDIFLAVAIGVMAFLVFFIAFLAVRHRNRTLEREAKLHALENEKQLAIFKSAVEAEDRQRDKIGRDLHDSIIPVLSVVQRSIGANITDFETPGFDFNRLKRDHNQIGHAIDNMRGLSHDLAPITLYSLGLIEAVKEHVVHEDGIDGVQARFENHTTFTKEMPLTPEDQHSIYRICLELLNNLSKHANYKKLKVTFGSRNQNLEIELMHNGIGITNEQFNTLSSVDGLGLKSLKARTMILKASLNYAVTPDFSFITLTVPLLT